MTLGVVESRVSQLHSARAVAGVLTTTTSASRKVLRPL